jgi:ribonucleoside-diphosphate reductase alpha chain
MVHAAGAAHDAAICPSTSCAGIAPRDHLLMQAELQPYVDGAISKTIALASDCTRTEIGEILEAAHDLGLKGCTLHRPEAHPGVIAARDDAGRAAQRVRGASQG